MMDTNSTTQVTPHSPTYTAEPRSTSHWKPIPASSWEPTAEHELLLKTLFGSEEVAITAWQAWVQQIDIERLDEGSYWLLPRLYQRLQQLPLAVDRIPSPRETATLQRIKGVYRHVWSRNQMILRDLAEAIQQLRQSDIPAIVVGGAALIAVPGADLGSRRADDSGLWVPPESVAAAMSTLKTLGWQPTRSRYGSRHAPRSPEQLRTQQTAVSLVRQRNNLILAWRILPECPGLGVAGEDSTTGLAVMLHTESVIALNPTDQCFVCCVQATRWQPRSPVYWLADAAHLIQTTEIDWERLIQLSQTHQLTLPLLASLSRIARLLDSAELTTVCQTLQHQHITAFERSEFTAKARPHPLWGQLPLLWFEYRRLCSHPWFNRPMAFIQFLAHRWGFNHPWQVFIHAAKQGLKRLFKPPSQ